MYSFLSRLGGGWGTCTADGGRRVICWRFLGFVNFYSILSLLLCESNLVIVFSVSYSHPCDLLAICVRHFCELPPEPAQVSAPSPPRLPPSLLDSLLFVLRLRARLPRSAHGFSSREPPIVGSRSMRRPSPLNLVRLRTYPSVCFCGHSVMFFLNLISLSLGG